MIAMELNFWKLQGNGNDFIIIDEYEREVIPGEMKAQFAGLYCDRRFGIGGDGVLFLSKSAEADLGMRLFQPDESEAEMCGNGIRCFAKYAFDSGYIGETGSIRTAAGVIRVEVAYKDDTFHASIDMPEPRFARADIPATGDGEYRENIAGFEVHAVNTGVPHAVIFSKDIDAIDLLAVAPAIRHHPGFPRGANVNIVEITGEDGMRIRTFERGIEGETLSCGTGATAAAAVAFHQGLVRSPVFVETEGGLLEVTLGDRTLLKGPAVTVFRGQILF
jgi:diaminopimelate epimerase